MQKNPDTPPAQISDATNPMNFIALSSSRGTTFQSVIDRMNDGSLTATCIGLITDKTDRGCIEKAKAASLPYRVISSDPKSDRETFDRKIHEAVESLAEEKSVDANEVILAEMGWMWIHTPWFIEKHEGKILNVHPALLPKYGGKGMYGKHVHNAVVSNNEKKSGISIHFVNEKYDEGKLIFQKEVELSEKDTAEMVAEKVHKLEYEYYPGIIEKVLENIN